MASDLSDPRDVRDVSERPVRSWLSSAVRASTICGRCSDATNASLAGGRELPSASRSCSRTIRLVPATKTRSDSWEHSIDMPGASAPASTLTTYGEPPSGADS